MKLELPDEYRIHPVFHTSLLKPFVSSTHPLIPPPPLLVNEQEQYEVNHIVDSRKKKGKLFYLVDWKGYPPEERTWEPVTHVHAPLPVRRFHARNPAKPRPVRQPLRRR